MASINQQNHLFYDRLNHQDRRYFNIHVPVREPYDDYWPGQNIRNAPLPQSEENRQTGSGKFSTMPVRHKGGALSPAVNNFLPGVGGEESKVYLHQSGIHSQVINKTKGQLGGAYHDNVLQKYIPVPKRKGPQLPTGPLPKMHLQRGGSFAHLRHHGQGNPALNNVFPGTRIPEPMRTYELSEGSKIHSRISDPIRPQAMITPANRGRLSSDDYKPFSETARYLGHNIHVRNNPLKIRG